MVDEGLAAFGGYPRRDVYASLLEGLERSYRATGNDPLYAWRAWSLARRGGVVVPVWVGEYLDHCAQEIDSLAVAHSHRRSASGRARGIARALGFARDGRGDSFSRAWAHARAGRLWVMVRRLRGDGMSAKAAQVETGASYKELGQKKPLDESTVRRALSALPPTD